MGNAVLISIRPKWCGKIVSGEKTVELRTNRPWTYRPAKVYIYCTKDRHLTFYRGKRYCYADDHAHNAFDIPCNGAIIGEFTCDDANFTRIVRIGDGVYPPKYCMCLPDGNVAPPDKIFIAPLIPVTSGSIAVDIYVMTFQALKEADERRKKDG